MVGMKTWTFGEHCVETLLAQRKQGFQFNPKSQLHSPPVREQSGGCRTPTRGRLQILFFTSTGRGRGTLVCHQRTLTSALLSALAATRCKNEVKSDPNSLKINTKSDLQICLPTYWIPDTSIEMKSPRAKLLPWLCFSFLAEAVNLELTLLLFLTREGIPTPSQQLTQD